jgi:hypothetical protein
MLFECIGLLSEQKIELSDGHTTEKGSKNMKEGAGAYLITGGEGFLLQPPSKTKAGRDFGTGRFR